MSTMKSKPRKSTGKEIAERVQVIADALTSGATRTEVHKLAREQWGVSWQQASEYARRARELLLKATDKPRNDWRKESVLLYDQLAGNAELTPSDRIRARRALDTLLGLDEPRRLDVTADVTAQTEIREQQDDLTPERVAEVMLWKIERDLAKAGPDALDAFVARVREQMSQRQRFTTTTTTAAKSSPSVEVLEPPPGATEPEPEPASSGWKPPVREPGKVIEETSVPACERVKIRRNGGYGVVGLF